MAIQRFLLVFGVFVGIATGTPVWAVVSDATNLVVITKTGFVLNRQTNTYDSVVTLKNISPFVVATPVQLVVSNLPADITLANAAGNTTQGNPYVGVNVPTNSILPGAVIAPIVLKFANPKRASLTPKLSLIGNIPDAAVGLPSDPGEAGKVTLAGVDSNNNGVRDDVERYIVLTVPESAKHREALKSYARTIQEGLLSSTQEQSIAAGDKESRSIECFSYLGVRKQMKWREVLALMFNTEARLNAQRDNLSRQSGQVYTSLPSDQYRTACDFNVEAQPN